MKSKVKATAKATTATTTDAKAKAAVTVQPLAKTIAAIMPMASAQASADAAMKTAEKQVIIVGTAVSKDTALQAAYKADGRAAVQTALKPYFVSAYAKAGKDETYAVQQLSRVLTIAFPGGQKASEKEQAKAQANMAKAIANNADTQTVLGMASGKLSYTAKGEVARTGKRRQGGSNAKTPAQTFETVIGNAVTAAHTGKVPPLAMVNMLLDALKACEAITEDEADDISAAAKKTL